jgi:hypothetical protein
MYFIRNKIPLNKPYFDPQEYLNVASFQRHVPYIHVYTKKKDKKQTNKKHDSKMSQYIISNIHVYVHCKHSINIEMILFRKHYTEYTRDILYWIYTYIIYKAWKQHHIDII